MNDRWNFEQKDGAILAKKVEPYYTDYITHAANRMNIICAEKEESDIFKNCNHFTLMRMEAAIRNELVRRGLK